MIMGYARIAASLAVGDVSILVPDLLLMPAVLIFTAIASVCVVLGVTNLQELPKRVSKHFLCVP